MADGNRHAALDDPLVRALVESLLATEPEHAVLLLDPDGRIVAWLGAASRLIGYPAGEMIGRHIREVFVPADRARRQAEEELAVALRARRTEDDRWHLREDGVAVWVSGTLTALRDPDGALIGFAKIMRDRSDLRTQIETLEARVEGLSQRLESATLMLRTIGHEMRNALAPMLNATAVLDRTELQRPSAVACGILRRQIAALQRQADDMMAFSRLESGRLELRLTTFELQPLLREIADARRAEAVERGMVLELLLPQVPIVLAADRERLQQVIVNLLDNALRHNGPGCRILLRATEESPDAVVRVEDDGVGIAPDKLPDLFVLFARGPSADGADGGMGIGLALARNLVELHGGSIEARSNGLNKGASFAVRVPLQPRAGA